MAGPRDQVVLDAIERYLDEVGSDRRLRFEPTDLRVFYMGPMEPLTRADIYSDEDDARS